MIDLALAIVFAPGDVMGGGGLNVTDEIPAQSRILILGASNKIACPLAIDMDHDLPAECLCGTRNHQCETTDNRDGMHHVNMPNQQPR